MNKKNTKIVSLLFASIVCSGFPAYTLQGQEQLKSKNSDEPNQLTAVDFKPSTDSVSEESTSLQKLDSAIEKTQKMIKETQKCLHPTVNTEEKKFYYIISSYKKAPDEELKKKFKYLMYDYISDHLETFIESAISETDRMRRAVADTNNQLKDLEKLLTAYRNEEEKKSSDLLKTFAQIDSALITPKIDDASTDRDSLGGGFQKAPDGEGGGFSPYRDGLGGGFQRAPDGESGGSGTNRDGLGGGFQRASVSFWHWLQAKFSRK